MLHTSRLTRVYLLVPTLFLLSMAMPVRGSDAKGNYVALGFGLEACQTFLEARSNGLDLPYRHWLTGYLTAVNTLTQVQGVVVMCEDFYPARIHAYVVTEISAMMQPL